MSLSVGLELDDNSLLLGTDSQLTYGDDIIGVHRRKLWFPLDWCGISGVGNVRDLADVNKRIVHYVKIQNPENKEELLKLIESAYTEVATTSIEGRAGKKRDIYLQVAGKEASDSSADIKEIVENPSDPKFDVFSCILLVGIANTGEKPELYSIQYPGYHESAYRFDANGPGEYYALRTIGRYLEDIPTETIPLHLGLRIIVDALRSGRQSSKVGGLFAVARVSNGPPVEYDRRAIRAGERSLELKDKGYLVNDDVTKVFKVLGNYRADSGNKTMPTEDPIQFLIEKIGADKLAELYLSD